MITDEFAIVLSAVSDLLHVATYVHKQHMFISALKL